MGKELYVNIENGDKEIREVSLNIPTNPSSITLDIELLQRWCEEVERQLRKEGIRINCPIPVKEME